jgi:hypothetical protein
MAPFELLQLRTLFVSCLANPRDHDQPTDAAIDGPPSRRLSSKLLFPPKASVASARERQDVTERFAAATVDGRLRFSPRNSNRLHDLLF